MALVVVRLVHELEAMDLADVSARGRFVVAVDHEHVPEGHGAFIIHPGLIHPDLSVGAGHHEAGLVRDGRRSGRDASHAGAELAANAVVEAFERFQGFSNCCPRGGSLFWAETTANNSIKMGFCQSIPLTQSCGG